MRRRSVDRRREDRSTREKRSLSCECYCKLKETNDESSPISSQRFIEKNTGNKCEKMTSQNATIDLDIPSPNKQQFKTKILESPTLSPDTQKAIEDAEKILEEARYKIIEAAKMPAAGSGRGIRKELYTEDLGPPLEDETEENLYIRELVSSRLNKINNEINEGSDISTDSKRIGKDKVIKKRSTDLLAPKFQTKERRDILYRPINHCSMFFEQTENSKFAVPNETKDNDSPVYNKTRKTKSLTIQKGPPLNIDRELKKQNLGFVHISPDTSYVESNTNINFYSFSHESSKKKEAPLKTMINEPDKKLIDNIMTDVIDKLDLSASENQKLTGETEIFEGTSFAKDDVAILTDKERKGGDVLFGSSINNRREKKDRGNVSEHLPRTGVDYFTLNDEPNSYYSNDARKNEGDLRYERKKITSKISNRNVGTNARYSLTQDERNETMSFLNDDKNSNYHEKRTKDEATKTDGDVELSYRRKKKIDRVISAKSIRTIHEPNLNNECHEVIDKHFSDILLRHDPSGRRSNKRDKFNEGKESTDLSDTSLHDTDTSFNDIELKAPSIETFENILLVYDKVIERASKSEKKIDDTLRRLELSLSNEFWKPVITNTAVGSYDLIPFKKTEDFRNIDKNDSMLLLSDKSKPMIVECKEDELEINPRTSNYVLKEGDLSFFKKKCNLKNESRLIKKRSKKINHAITSDESCSSIENITDENKISEPKNKIKSLSNDKKLGNYESLKDDAQVEPLMSKSAEWREKKLEFERAVVNNLSGLGHTPSMLKEIMKNLQTFSNTRSQDVPTILKNFIMDFMNRDSGLVLDFLSIQKPDDGTAYTNLVQNGGSLQAIAQDKIYKDLTSDSHVSQESSLTYNSNKFVSSKEKSLKMCPVNLIEIKPTDVIDELSQTEIEVVEKGTQYEVSSEKNEHRDDKLIKDVRSDKNSTENILEKNNRMEEHPTKDIEINNSDITKSQFVKNNDTEKNSKSSEANIISMDCVKNTIMKDLHSDPSFSKSILDKLSDSENSSSRISIADVKRIMHKNVSRFITTLSETSHSEGELYLPSSCSYSLGEVKMVKNSTSTCNHAFVNACTSNYLDETKSVLQYSSGEIYVDSSDTL